ncbi:hypothetical protein ACLOJK_014348 [Asimina triloba]
MRRSSHETAQAQAAQDSFLRWTRAFSPTAMAPRLALVEASSTNKPSTLLNTVFMSTVNTAAKMLYAVAKSASGEVQRWSPTDHFRYMTMLMIWMTIWVLRVMVDYFPCSIIQSPPAILDKLMSAKSPPSDSLVLNQGYGDGSDGPSTNAIGRALSHVFALVNDTPAFSRKYQFAVAMADRIVDENAREGHKSLLEINRAALSSAFARTSNLLYCCLQSIVSIYTRSDQSGTWPARVLQSLPLGSHLLSSFKGIFFCLGGFLPSSIDTGRSQKQLAAAGEVTCGEDGVMAEKLAQELLWITSKMRLCSAVDEAVVQWSFASGLASLALTANPRVQGTIVKITGGKWESALISFWSSNMELPILMRELARWDFEAGRQVKFRLFVLWLPICCYASNGLSCPVLTGYEKMEMERVMEDVISSLPATDQEVILTNWLHDFTVSTSDWPNLQRCFDRWCRCSRKLLL